MDLTCFSSTYRRYSIGLRSGEFGGQVITFKLIVLWMYQGGDDSDESGGDSF